MLLLGRSNALGAMCRRKPPVPSISPSSQIRPVFLLHAKPRRAQLSSIACKATEGNDDVEAADMIKQQVGAMAPEDIRLELQRRGLSASGKMADVMERLVDSIISSETADATPEESFSPGILDTLDALSYDQAMLLRKKFQLKLSGRKKGDVVILLARLAEEVGLENVLAGLEEGDADAAATAGSDDEADDESDLDASVVKVFEAMTTTNLSKICRGLGLACPTKKRDLVELLTRTAMRNGLESVLGESGTAVAPKLSAKADEESFSASTDVEFGEDEDDMGGLDPFMIKAELRNMSRAELVDVLISKDAPSEGTDEELVDRLADIIAEEVESELQSGQAMEVEEADQDSLISDEQVELLVERLSSQMHSFFMTNTRPALYSELKSMGVESPYSNKAELAAKMAQAKARVEVESLVQAARTDPNVAKELFDQLELIAAEGEASAVEEVADEAETLDVDIDEIKTVEQISNVPTSQIARLRVSIMRDLLERVGSPTEGNSYDLRERIIELRNKSRANVLAKSSSQKYKVKVMPLRDLRSQLATWKQSTSGSRQQLEDRLLDTLAKMSPAVEEETDEEIPVEEVEEEEDFSLEDGPHAYFDDTYDLRVENRDPNMQIAVLCGSPLGNLSMAENSLEAARALLDALYTAPLPLLGPLRGGERYQEELKERKALLDLVEEAVDEIDNEEDEMEEEYAEGEEGAEDEEGDEGANLEREEDDDFQEDEGAEEEEEQEAEYEEGEEEEEEEGEKIEIKYIDGYDEVDEEDWRPEASGVKVQVYYVDSSMQVHVLQPRDLLTSTAATLEASYGSHEILADHKALISHLSEGDNKLVFPTFVGPSSKPQTASAYMSSDLGRTNEAALADLLTSLRTTPKVQLLCSSSPEALALAGDKWACSKKLEELGYPTVPAFKVSLDQVGEAELADELADNMEEPVWVADLKAWCKEMGWETTYKHFVVKPTCGAYGEGVIPARGIADAVLIARELLKNQRNSASSSSSPSTASVLIEPFMGRAAVEFSCTVIETPGGEPMALMPTEIDIYDIEKTIFESEVDRAEWNMSRSGASAEEVAWEVEKLRSAALPHPKYGVFVPSRQYLPTQVVKYHCPPRLSRRMTHHIRHAAAKLFTQLGLEGAARVDGWVALSPDWKNLHARKDTDIENLPDQDPIIIAKEMEKKEMAFRRDPTPLKEYYDYWEWHYADLDKFIPSERLEASVNGEGTVFIADVNVHESSGVDLGPGSLALHQAAELGLTPASLMRNMVNAALGRHARKQDSDEALPLLPTARVTDTWSSALLNHLAPERWDLLERLRKINDENDMLEELAVQDRQEKLDHVNELTMELMDMVPEAMALYNPQGTKALQDMFDRDEGEEDEEGEEMAEMAEEEEISDYELLPTASLSEVEILLESIEKAVEEEDGEEEEEMGEIELEEGRPQTEADFEDELIESGGGLLENGEEQLALDLFQQFEANSGGWEPDLEDERTQEEKHLARQAAPFTDVEKLRNEYPDLTEDDYMYLMLGVTSDGTTINPDAFVAFCRAKAAANAAAEQIDIYAEATADYDEGNFDYEDEDELDLVGEAQDEEEEMEEVEDGEYEEIEIEEPEAPEVLPSLAADLDLAGKPHKVWVLMGGDPDLSNSSLASGLNVIRKLSRYADLQVEGFMMVPPGAGRDEERRRTRLLKKRNDLLSLGCADTELPSHMQLSELRVMPHMDTVIETEFVWALPPQSTLYHNAAAVLDACERSLRLNATSQYALAPLDKQSQQVRQDVQAELAAAGIEGVAGMWGGNPMDLPIPPRLLSLDQFTSEAEDRGATVFMAMKGGLAQGGVVHQWLDAFDVPYTGSGALSNLSCSDKLSLPEVLDEIQPIGVATIPSRMLVQGILEDVAMSEEYAESIYSTVQIELEQDGAPQGGPLHIRPSMLGAGLASVFLKTPMDLMIFSQAAVNGTPFIPAGALSYPHNDISMPKFPPPFFLVEPYIPADPIFVRPDPDQATDPDSRSEIFFKGESNWVEVSIGLLGHMGNMQAMSVSALAKLLPTNVTVEEAMDSKAAAANMYLTPVPEIIASDITLREAMARAEAATDKLCLTGIARLDAFMHVTTGELIVIELETLPDLGPDSILYQQALNPLSGFHPLYPHELLRAVVGMAKDDQADNIDEDSILLESGGGEAEDEMDNDDDDADLEYDLGSLPVGGRGGGEDEWSDTGAGNDSFSDINGGAAESGDTYDSWDLSGTNTFMAEE